MKSTILIFPSYLLLRIANDNFPSRASNADANRDSIHFIKYEVDNIVEISKELKISYTPAFIAFKDGERVDDIVSSDPVALEAFINKLNE